MKEVCVITGGGSGMGLATARLLGKDYVVILAGRNQDKLQGAMKALQAEGVEAFSRPCDVANRAAVEDLAKYCETKGRIRVVIHAAGISPSMGKPETIISVNALGTVNVHNAFFPFLEEGACLINVASMGGYIVPGLILPKRAFIFSQKNTNRFLEKMIARTRWFPSSLRAGLAYGISKNFVIWYSRVEADRFGQKGVRVLSVSPGAFETDMGDLEREGAEEFVQYCAIKRFGKVEEIAALLALCADKRLGYLTGVDIVCDGGCLANYMRSPLSKLGMTRKQG